MIDALMHPVAPREAPSDDIFSALIAHAGRTRAWRSPLPWSLAREGDALILQLDVLREELLHDPANRETVMACGAVLENLRVAAHHFARELVIERWPGDGSDTVARLTLTPSRHTRHEEEALYSVLEGRRSRQRASFGGGGVSPALVAVLRHAARCEGGWLDVIADDARREIVGDLESEAAAITNAERGARRLLALRLGNHGPRGEHLWLGGGPALGELLVALGARVHPDAAWTQDRAVAVRGSAVAAPLLAVLGCTADTPDAWLNAGAALQRVLLHASVQGLVATFLNEPLHHPLLRDALRSVLFASGAPQAIVRFDFADDDGVLDRPSTTGTRATAA